MLRLMEFLFRWMRLGVAPNGVCVSLDETRFLRLMEFVFLWMKLCFCA